MNKIKEIVLSWAIKMNPTDEQRRVAELRLETCVSCEHWDNGGAFEKCSLCGCATKVKVFTPVGSGACPKQKWTI